jgi:hypothetical protein
MKRCVGSELLAGPIKQARMMNGTSCVLRSGTGDAVIARKGNVNRGVVLIGPGNTATLLGNSTNEAEQLAVSTAVGAVRPRRRAAIGCTPVVDRKLPAMDAELEFATRLLERVHQLRPVPVPARGNCQFDSIAVLVFGRLARGFGGRVRKEIVEYAQERPYMWAGIAASFGKTIDEWVKYTLKNGNWGSHIHILIAEEVYDVRINVFLASGGAASVGSNEAEPLYEAIAHRPVRSILFNEKTQHYEPLVPLSGATAVPCVGPERLLEIARRDAWAAFEPPVSAGNGTNCVVV